MMIKQLSSILILLWAPSSQAFVAPIIARHHQRAATTSASRFVSQHVSAAATVESDFASAMPAEDTVYDKLGIEEEQLAIGVDPDKVLKYIGTRDSLLEKTMTDIPSFNRETAEAEVDKFLLDYDALNMYIEFQKRKEEDPDFVVPGGEDRNELFSARNIVLLYLGYVGATAGPKALRDFVATKEAAGEWSGTGIPALEEWLHQVPGVAVSAASGVADTVAQAVTDVAPVVDGLLS